MKNVLLNSLAALAVAFAASSVATATPIIGGVNFDGSSTVGNNLVFTVTGPASANVAFINGAITAGVGPSFTGLNFATVDSTLSFASLNLFGAVPPGSLNFTGGSLPGATDNGGNLWSFDSGGLDYSFKATTITVQAAGNNSWNVGGVGLFSISGSDFDSTYGTWNLTLSDNSGVGFTVTNFESTNGTTGPTIPDGGTTALLVGLGLIGLGVFTRRRSRLAKA